MEPTVTVYVKSRKIEEEYMPFKGTIYERSTHFGEITYSKGIRPDFLSLHKRKWCKYVLPDDQEKAVELVKLVAKEQGYTVKIIDVTEKNTIYKFVQEKIKRRIFPTIETSLGDKLEGQVSKDQIERLLSSRCA